MKNIQTHNAKIELIRKFLDYLNIADASYALLHYVNENAEKDIKNNIFKADGLAFKDKLENDMNFKDKNNKKYTKPKGTNTAYACAIEARFQKDKTIRIEPKLCIPLLNTCLSSKEITLNNDITKVGLNDAFSQRTIDFVNRFKLLVHQENKEGSRKKGEESDGNYGFSATLFEDTKTESNDARYILAFRGSEDKNDFLTDHILAEGGIPMQCYFAVKFYEEKIKDIIGDSKLIVVGHSLGGYLAQSFCFMYPSKIAELYTFNSPGLYPDGELKTIIQLYDNIIDSNVTKAYITLNHRKLNSYVSLLILNSARKCNYNKYVYNPDNIQIESLKIKEKYHQK